MSKPIDKMIHEDRLVQECLFQHLIKQKPLQDIKIKDIKNISYYSARLVMGIIHELKEYKGKFEITDDLANSDYWIQKLLRKNYSGWYSSCRQIGNKITEKKSEIT